MKKTFRYIHERGNNKTLFSSINKENHQGNHNDLEGNTYRSHAFASSAILGDDINFYKEEVNM